MVLSSILIVIGIVSLIYGANWLVNNFFLEQELEKSRLDRGILLILFLRFLFYFFRQMKQEKVEDILSSSGHHINVHSLFLGDAKTFGL